MNNAAYYFDELAVIIKAGNRPSSVFSDAHDEALCLHFREVFVLWDGAFSLAQTVNPTEHDMTTNLRYVQDAVHGNAALHCTVTPKVHLMLKHVACQMRNIWGGLGDKMEDWVECLHQTGMRLQQRFRTVQNPCHPCSCAGEGEFRFVASRCDCSHRGNKHREQAFLFCRENRQLNFDASKKAARYEPIQGDDIF